MSLSLFSKKHYVYCGDTESSLLAEVDKSKGGKLALKTIATEDGPPTNPDIISRLLLQTSPSAGKVSMALPLEVFEVLSLSLPLLPDDAIERTLPYHISKAIDKPITDYIYDWQVNKRFKDQMQVSVYLFPACTYKEIEQEFNNNNLEVSYFEADAFAAFSYLDASEIINANETSMCVLVWPESLTLAVCESGQIELARTVDIVRPKEADSSYDYSDKTDSIDPGLETIQPPTLDEDTLSLENSTEDIPDTIIGIDNDEESDSILAGFQLIDQTEQQDDADSDQLVIEVDEDEKEIGILSVEKTEEVPVGKTPLDDYLDAISVEIMRTRDYYGTVIKGKQIQNYYILGAEEYFDSLSELVEQNMGERINKVMSEPSKSHCRPSLYAIGLGAGSRW